MSFKLNKLAATIIPVTVATASAFISTNSMAGYLVDSKGTIVRSGYNLCWDGVWPKPDQIEECGDKVAMPEPEPAPMPKAMPEPEPAPMDSDGDGVYDENDKCPSTPAGVAVDASGCALDSDGDGVLNADDKCPGTPAGAKVNADGCDIIDNMTIDTVGEEFDFNSAKLKPEMKAALDAVVVKLNSTAGEESLDIIGHTDSSGPAEYNRVLSEKRANAVADYLAAKGISRSKMTISGRGEAEPVADNGTRDGRKKNRRVEIHTR